MKDELATVIRKMRSTQLALESLRAKDTKRTLELLELELDLSIDAVGRIAKEAAPGQLESITEALQLVQAYRRAHPRRIEADLSSLANGVLVRAADVAGARARKILAEIK